MIHYKARQLNSGLWHYTALQDDIIRPVGYCGIPADKIIEWCKNNDFDTTSYINSINLHKHKYHLDGHTTQKLAENCYKNYLLDFETRYNLSLKDMKVPCQICKEYTELYVLVGFYHVFNLCNAHNLRNFVETLFEVGESWES